MSLFPLAPLTPTDIADVVESRRIYITGAAGVGTTLLLRLFSAFYDVECHWREIDPVGFMDLKTRRRVLVGKRTADAVFAGRCPGVMAERHLAALSGADIVYMRRDKVRDQTRLLLANMQATQHAAHIACAVDYLALLSYPDRTQRRLARCLDLHIKHLWSTYPDFVPEAAFESNRTTRSDKRYRARPLGEAP